MRTVFLYPITHADDPHGRLNNFNLPQEYEKDNQQPIQQFQDSYSKES